MAYLLNQAHEQRRSPLLFLRGVRARADHRISAQAARATTSSCSCRQPAATSLFSREYAEVGPKWEPYAGIWINYANAPLVRYVNGKLASEVVANQLTLDVVGAVSLFHIVEAGVGVPFVPIQTGGGLPATPTEAARGARQRRLR